ncbi:transposase [Endozoicomonas euniceicola]|uniref:transposase n=1 Tax=Endozoicomonas euniceicola TaxID=1234143 RepID=UPI00384CBC9E
MSSYTYFLFRNIHGMRGKASLYVLSTGFEAQDYAAKNVKDRQRNFNGEHFWVRGYFVSTVGLDEEVVRAYI